MLSSCEIVDYVIFVYIYSDHAKKDAPRVIAVLVIDTLLRSFNVFDRDYQGGRGA